MEAKYYGRKLDHRIGELGIKQKELARPNGPYSSENYVSQVINANIVPSGTTLVEVARLLRVTAEYLMDDEIPVGEIRRPSESEEMVRRIASKIGWGEIEDRLLDYLADSAGPKLSRGFWGEVVKEDDQGNHPDRPKKPKSGA